MSYAHVLLEVFCDRKCEEFDYCKVGQIPGFHCFANDCKYLRYTLCENEIAYVSEDGASPSKDFWVGFGGDMEPNYEDNKAELILEWKNICKKKIDEAYEEYMLYKTNRNL